MPKPALKLTAVPETLSQRQFIHGTGKLVKTVSNIHSINPTTAILLV
jgi:hypothetical protein